MTTIKIFYVIVSKTDLTQWEWETSPFDSKDIGICDMKVFQCKGLENALKVMNYYKKDAVLLKSLDFNTIEEAL